MKHVDSTGSIKFTDEPETKGIIPFLDALIFHKEDGSVKIQVYQKKTHTDQYLHVNSHYPLNHNLEVIQTLYDRCTNIDVDPVDSMKEITHMNHALSKY